MVIEPTSFVLARCVGGGEQPAAAAAATESSNSRDPEIPVPGRFFIGDVLSTRGHVNGKARGEH
jgi:hypothetical protein